MNTCKQCIHATFDGYCDRKQARTVLNAPACDVFETHPREDMLLMCGKKTEWPPRDEDGTPINIGDRVYGLNDSYNFHSEHEFTVGALRLQITGGDLLWVVQAYDDAEFFFECFACDCKVLDAPPTE